MNIKHVAVASALATLGSSAFAQTYVGIGLGASHTCINTYGDSRCADDGVAGKALVGYAWPGTDFAIEGIYSHLGNFRRSWDAGKVDFKIDTLGVGGAWRPQFGPSGWGGVVRAGIEYGTVKGRHTQVGPDHSGSSVFTSDDGAWQPYLGGGVTYAITPRIKLEGDLDVTRVRANGLHSNTAVASAMLGVTFGF